MRTNVTWSALISKTASDFVQDKAPRLGAALAFYAAFSVVPLLIIATTVASQFFGTEAVEGHLKHQLVDLIGSDGADGIQAMIAAARKSHSAGLIATIVAVTALVFGATGVFIELKDSINTIWGVELRPELGVFGSIKDSAMAFVTVLIVAFLLLVSMVLTTIMTAISHEIAIPVAAHWIDFTATITVTTLLFAGIYKYLPDVLILWKDVWVGAIATALLFTLGKHLVGLYVANTHLATTYGAVSSVLVFLLWTYYSSQIFFLGAEFTQAYSQLHGRGGTPALNARAIAGGRLATKSVRVGDHEFHATLWH